MKRTVVGTTLLIALLVAGCAPKVDPFRISADQFRRRVKTIAVAQIFADPQRIQQAVNYALDPFFKRD